MSAANDAYSLPSIGLPMELPEKPDGWARKMELHMNFGSAGGAAVYSITNPDGVTMPISYQYDTRKGKQREMETGFFIVDKKRPGGFYGDVCATWPELRALWAKWMTERTQQGAAS